MTDRCAYCNRFIPPSWMDEHCERCIEMFSAESNEAEIGIGTGSYISGKFGTPEYCRHAVKRKTNVPMGKLRLLT